MIPHFPPTALLLLALLAVSSSCAPVGVPESPREAVRDREAGQPAALAASLQVESLGDSVRFSLRVTNASPLPAGLTFRTGQSFDLVVLQGEREVWRWSADMMFTQAIRYETLEPEETWSYGATWTPPAGTRGRFEVRAFLTAEEQRLEQRTEFRLP